MLIRKTSAGCCCCTRPPTVSGQERIAASPRRRGDATHRETSARIAYERHQGGVEAAAGVRAAGDATRESSARMLRSYAEARPTARSLRRCAIFPSRGLACYLPEQALLELENSLLVLPILRRA